MKNRAPSIIVVLMLAAALVLPGANTARAVAGSMTVVSDTSTIVTATTSGLAVPHNAVLAWEPWNDADPSYWDSNLVDYTFPTGADWIWDTYRTYNVVTGDIVTFQKTFNVPGIPTGGVLHITTDNGYVVSLNGHDIGSAQLSAGWGPGNLTQTYVNTTDWQSVEMWTIPAATLLNGVNVLTITGVNEYMYPDDNDSNGNAQDEGTQGSNPAGLIFQLDVSYETGLGYTHTWGYWKTHSSHGPAGPYDDAWTILGENTQFFLSDTTYYGVLEINPAGGNAYYQLAHQYVAAKLDVLDGAWMRADVQAAFDQATALLAVHTPGQIATFKKGDAGQKAIFSQFNQLASILDQYNNGLLGTPHAP